MSLESDYKELVKYAHACARNASIPLVGEEVVTEAFLLLAGTEYNKDVFKYNIICVLKNYRKNINEILTDDIETAQDFFVQKNRVEEHDRQCLKCSEVKNYTQFHKNYVGKDGISYKNKICRDCINKNNREKYLINRFQLCGDIPFPKPRATGYTTIRSKTEEEKKEMIRRNNEKARKKPDYKSKNATAQREWYRRNKERLKNDPEYLRKASQRSYASQLRRKKAA